jgi:hypothetical protein
MLYLISLPPTCLLQLFLVENYQLDEGNEVVPASKKHYGKGEEY